MSSYLSVVKVGAFLLLSSPLNGTHPDCRRSLHCQAEYAYEAATDEELTIEEDQVLYVLEDDDAE